MTKDYTRNQRSRASRPHYSTHIFLALLFFVLGYLIATFANSPQWLLFLKSHHEKRRETKPIVAKKNQEIPKPKFEFYTLLARDNTPPRPSVRPTSEARVVIAQKNAVSTIPAVEPGNKDLKNVQNIPHLKEPSGTGTSTAVKTNEEFLVQVAAFSRRDDAEKVKAALILKGYDVSILTILQGQMNWFRVMIGPFPSRMAAERAQVVIARNEHMKGMIRKKT